MDFPIVELLDEAECAAWLKAHFHPQGLKCPRCECEQAYAFRQTVRSRVQVFRCKDCLQTYTLYSGTVFEGHQLRPSQVVLLLRGVVQGVPATRLSRELGLCRTTVQHLRGELQAQARQRRPTTALPDAHTETDELFQNAGEKKHPPLQPCRPAPAARQ